MQAVATTQYKIACPPELEGKEHLLGPIPSNPPVIYLRKVKLERLCRKCKNKSS